VTVHGDLAGFVRDGLSLYNAGRYWEAHEAWERVWRAVPEDEREPWQGLIQAAAAMLHRERGNAHGLATLGEAAIARLGASGAGALPVDLEAFGPALARCRREGAPAPKLELRARDEGKD
jgi:predicted metal-dependent hydrolase